VVDRACGIGPESAQGDARYDPTVDDKMQGFMVLARYGSDQPGHDLGKIDTLHIHPTVAKLLGIQPASGASDRPLNRCPRLGLFTLVWLIWSERLFLQADWAVFFLQCAGACAGDFCF